MRIDRVHPLNREIIVFLNGVKQEYCTEADDLAGYATVAVLDEKGKPAADPVTGEDVLQVKYGRVRFEIQPGWEQQFNWFQIGWRYGWDECEEKLKEGDVPDI
jgi:hypothetical protein